MGEVLTKAELAALMERLKLYSPVALDDFYRKAYWQCRLADGHIPKPRSMQELVAAWKVLRSR